MHKSWHIHLDYTFTGTPGIDLNKLNGQQPIDFFNAFFTEEVKELIFRETTRYAEQDLEANKQYLEDHKYARGNQWKHNPMKREEVDILLGVLIVMGVVGFPTQRYYVSPTLVQLLCF